MTDFINLNRRENFRSNIINLSIFLNKYGPPLVSLEVKAKVEYKKLYLLSYCSSYIKGYVYALQSLQYSIAISDWHTSHSMSSYELSYTFWQYMSYRQAYMVYVNCKL